MYDSQMFYYSLLLSIIAPLFFFLGGPRSSFWIAVGIAFMLLITYDGVVLGATRSIAISMAAFAAFAMPSLWKVSAIQPQRLAARRRMRLAAIAIAFGCVVVVLICLGRLGTSHSAIAERFVSRAGASSSEGRIEEARIMMRGFSLEEWILGRGFGGETPGANNMYVAYALHIGILTFLLKGGVILLAISVIVFYVALPLRYAVACLRSAAGTTPDDVGILCVAPGLAAWLAMLAMSGGYTVYASFGVGVCLAAYSALCSQGRPGLPGFVPCRVASHSKRRAVWATAPLEGVSPALSRRRVSTGVPWRKLFNKAGQGPASRHPLLRPFSKKAGRAI
jgi:hypothetical protein